MQELGELPNSVPLLAAAGAAERVGDGFRVEVPGLAVAGGGAVAILGPSGAGKSTVLRGLLGLHGAPRVDWRGERSFDDRPWPEVGSAAHRTLLRRELCVLPQDARAALDPLDRLGAQLRELVRGASTGDPAEALAALGIADAAHLLQRYPHEVSGGQAQAVLLALASLRRPRLLVADEPTTGLDRERTLELVGRLEALRAGGTALLVATHDDELVRALGAATWVVRAGRLEAEDREPEPWPTREPRSVSVAEPVALRATDVAVDLGGHRVLERADIELRRGESVGLVGAPGCGKTTFARVLARQLRPARGRVEIAGAACAVQLVFQDAYGSLTPQRAVGSLVAEVAAPDFDVEAEAAALGLPADKLGCTPDRLSGGERRRAALLRALSVRPSVLLLDEPTAELDRHTAIEVVGVLLAAQRRTGVAMLWITHDRALAAAVTDRTVAIQRGRTCSPPPR